MIFILDHYYEGYGHHPSFCFAVQSDVLSVEDMIELTSAIEFLFEFTVDIDSRLEQMKLKQILCDYYGTKDVTQKHQKNITAAVKEVKWDGIDTYFYNGSASFVHIDLYEARDFCCGTRCDKIMKKWLPKGTRQEIVGCLKEME